MRQTPAIKKLIAFSLLLVFMISAAPKAWFHDAVADHKDRPVSCNHDHKPLTCLHEAGYNCHFDQLVVNSIFDFTPLKWNTGYSVLHSNDQSFFLKYFYSNHLSSKKGRAPPSFV